MAKTNNGGPAAQNLTVRDAFAMQFASNSVVCVPASEEYARLLATAAYAYADAMLAVRELEEVKRFAGE